MSKIPLSDVVCGVYYVVVEAEENNALNVKVGDKVVLESSMLGGALLYWTSDRASSPTNGRLADDVKGIYVEVDTARYIGVFKQIATHMLEISDLMDSFSTFMNYLGRQNEDTKSDTD